RHRDDADIVLGARLFGIAGRQSVGYFRDQVVALAFWLATDSKASIKGAGNSFPRLAARRRIPAHALAVKKYRCGSSPVSKISDNEHTPPSVWDGSRKAACSDELSVKDSVGPPIPEFAQPPEEGSKIPSAVARQDAG